MVLSRLPSPFCRPVSHETNLCFQMDVIQTPLNLISEISPVALMKLIKNEVELEVSIRHFLLYRSDLSINMPYCTLLT